MREKIFVLYDFATMASVAVDRAQYTGIQRVAHETAAGLATRQEVHLGLYGANVQYLAQKFAKQDSRLRNCAFTRLAEQRRTDALLDRLEALARRRSHSRSFTDRLTRKLASLSLRALSHRRGPMDPASLAGYDIYHSPAPAFPAVVLQSHIKKFLTVYDLTPVKMPQHSHPHILYDYRRMLAGLPRDGYYLCISEHTKRDWCDHTGAAPERCFVTPLAASRHFAPCTDPQRMTQVRQKYQIPSGRYFLSVGTLEPRKNLLLVIRAFLDLWRQTKDDSLYLVLVGRRGWQEDEILQAAGAPLAGQRIRFTGYVAEEDLSALYSGALAFLYMSFYEGFGLPPLEAMQCGTPTVTSNTSSLPEVVGSAGIMLDPLDPVALSETMYQLCHDEALRHSLSIRALERAQLFSWERCVDLTVAAYQQAMKS